MQGIGPGSILGGRYVAGQRTAQHQGFELWDARDSTLDRQVVVLAMSREHPNVDAVLDAARRVSGLDNARLSRTFEVVTDGDLAFVVEEALEGARSLAELLEAGPLPAPEVRRIAGEAAVVLDVARHRGLHHQQLHPGLVLRTPDGDIKVRGLATLAALAGVDHLTDQAAARADAVAVVGLAYAGLTGHWPIPGDSGGLPAAPEVGGHTAPPSEIASGVPADLDALCRLTLINGQGPTTPGGFARQIAPWSPIPVILPTLPASPPEHRIPSPPAGRDTPKPSSATAPSPEGPTGDAPAAAAESGAPATKTAVPRSHSGHPVRVAHRVPAPVPAAAGASDAAASADGADSADGSARDRRTEGAGDGSAGDDTRDTSSTAREPGTTPAAAGATPDAAGASPEAAAATDQAEPPGPGSGVAAAGAAPLGPSPLATAGAKAAAAFAAAAAAAAGAARSVRDKARTASEERRARREAAAVARAEQARARESAQDRELQPASVSATTTDTTTDTATSEQSAAGDSPTPASTQRATATTRVVKRRDADALEPPVPLLPPSAAEPLTRDQSRIAIGIIVGFLVLSFGFALWGLSQIPSLPGFGEEPTGVVTSTPTPDDDADADAGAGDSTPGGASAGAPLTFVDAIDYDPLGNGEERPEDLPRILDGDDSTYWQSEGYQNSTFSGLKPGVGVILDLGEVSTVSEVTLELPLEASGSIYVTDDDTYVEERPAIRTDQEPAGAFSGEGSVSVPLANGTSGRYVIVWFTEVSRSGDWHRARLAGASATS